MVRTKLWYKVSTNICSLKNGRNKTEGNANNKVTLKGNI